MPTAAVEEQIELVELVAPSRRSTAAPPTTSTLGHHASQRVRGILKDETRIVVDKSGKAHMFVINKICWYAVRHLWLAQDPVTKKETNRVNCDRIAGAYSLEDARSILSAEMFRIDPRSIPSGTVVSRPLAHDAAKLVGIRHYAVYIQDDKGDYVVEYAQNPDEESDPNTKKPIVVRATPVQTFLQKAVSFFGFYDVQIHVYTGQFQEDKIAARAKAEIGKGEGKYSAAFKNCEHFTSWCATGYASSSQVLQWSIWALTRAVRTSLSLLPLVFAGDAISAGSATAAGAAASSAALASAAPALPYILLGILGLIALAAAILIGYETYQASIPREQFFS